MNTGGPAFPVPDSHHANGQVQYGANGMTLLDWMAGQALAGLVSESGRYDSAGAASDAYNFAAAMLAEKARREADHSEDKLGKVPHREVDNDYWAKFQDGIRIVFQPTNGWCAEIRDGSMGWGNTIAEAVANLRARWEERNAVPESKAFQDQMKSVMEKPVVVECVAALCRDHSPDAGKMVWKQSPNMSCAIICETQFSETHADEENVTAYGGYLVAESVPEEAKPLIIRAPKLETENRELVEALELLVGANAATSLCMHEGPDSVGRVLGTWQLKAEAKARATLFKHKGAA